MPVITMPQLGESVTEGTIGRWLKKPGDRVERDESLVEIITDKVNAEIPSPAAGVLERISAEEGTVVAVGQEIAFLATGAEAKAPTPVAASGSPPATVAVANAPSSGEVEAEAAEGEQPRSSPLVRRLAKEHGLDLRLITGTGQGGRVTRDDVEAYLREHASADVGGTASPMPTPIVASPTAAATASSATSAAPAATPPMPSVAPTAGEERGIEHITPTPMRRTIAQRMLQSVREIPQAWLMIEVDVSQLVQLRESLKEGFRQSEGVDLTYLPFLMKAAVDALREFPLVNSTWQDDQIVVKREINLGVAVALENGLVVPVIREADQRNVVGLAHALADVVGRARAGKLTVADVEGGTFTVNNTGAFGSIASKPIINYPQAGIMTMESIVKRPVVIGDAIAIRSMVNLCLSFDHRILDGLTAGRFLQSVKRHLEAWGPGRAL